MSHLNTNRIKELRNERSMSQQQLAGLLGTSHSAISKLETGKLELKARQIRLIAQVFGVHPGEVLEPLPAGTLSDQEEPELNRLLRKKLLGKNES